MSEINENTIIINFDRDRDLEYIISDFDKNFEYIEDTYEYILRPFENMLETGEQIDTFTEEKLNHIKELNFEGFEIRLKTFCQWKPLLISSLLFFIIFIHRIWRGFITPKPNR